MLTNFVAAFTRSTSPRRLCVTAGVDDQDVDLYRYCGQAWHRPVAHSRPEPRPLRSIYASAKFGYQLQFRCKICPDRIGEVADLSGPMPRTSGTEGRFTRRRRVAPCRHRSGLPRGCPGGRNRTDACQSSQRMIKACVYRAKDGLKSAGLRDIFNNWQAWSGACSAGEPRTPDRESAIEICCNPTLTLFVSEFPRTGALFQANSIRAS